MNPNFLNYLPATEIPGFLMNNVYQSSVSSQVCVRDQFQSIDEADKSLRKQNHIITSAIIEEFSIADSIRNAMYQSYVKIFTGFPALYFSHLQGYKDVFSWLTDLKIVTVSIFHLFAEYFLQQIETFLLTLTLVAIMALLTIQGGTFIVILYKMNVPPGFMYFLYGCLSVVVISTRLIIAQPKRVHFKYAAKEI